jgi:hypothetical protein
MQMLKALPARVGDAAAQRRTLAVPARAGRGEGTSAQSLNGNGDIKIGSIDDPLEHEADRIADIVMRMPDSGLSLTAAHGQVSRKCACEEDEEPNLLQAKSVGSAGHESPANVHQVIRSPGQSLDSKTRESFEPRFRRDFSDVRIHTDSAAGASARRMNALGYTVGRHVVFADGQYSPETMSGRRLLAHELAHVVQQSMCGLSAGVVRRKENPRRAWSPSLIEAGVGVLDSPDTFSCMTSTNIRGRHLTTANFSGRLPDDVRAKRFRLGGEWSDDEGATYASACLFPCVGQPLNLRALFWVDAPDAERPEPFDPPRLSLTVYFFPDAGDPDVVTKETSTGRYAGPGAPLDTGFGDLTFFTPDSPGKLMVRASIEDPTSGTVAVYSESIRVITCPPIATEPEPEAAKLEEPGKGRHRFNILVPDPDNAPQIYEFVGPNTELDGPGGIFPVWQDATGVYYYWNNERRVYLPNFSPP